MTKKVTQMVWHPIDTQVPPYQQHVLVTLSDSKRRKSVQIGYRLRTDSAGEHFCDTGATQFSYRGLKVTAWMPIPEHYRG